MSSFEGIVAAAPFALAAIAAIVLGAIELRSRMKSRPTFDNDVRGLWVLKGALDGAIGVLGVLLVRAAGGGSLIPGVPEWITLGFLGALAGPTLARTALFTTGKGDDQKSFGLNFIYDALRDPIETKLDRLGAADEDAWLNTNVIPAIQRKGMSPADISTRWKGYLRDLTGVKATELKAALDHIPVILDDAGSSDQDRIRALLQDALDLRAWDWVGRLSR